MLKEGMDLAVHLHRAQAPIHRLMVGHRVLVLNKLAIILIVEEVAVTLMQIKIITIKSNRPTSS